jgi:perosamine synthetase
MSKNIARKIFTSIFMNKSINLVSLNSPTLDEDDIKIAKYFLKNKSSWYNDEIIKEFENFFASWNESKYAYTFMGGRVALSAIIFALGLKEGDEVILPGYTCVVVPNAFKYEDIKIIYSDIELDTYGIDAEDLEVKITSNTKAILIHHLYGLICRDYEKILNIARKYNLKIIEDCAHATGAKYKGIKAGNLGDASFYSLEQSKVITTAQGGVVVTNNQDISKKIKEYQDASCFPDTKKIEDILNTLILNYYINQSSDRWWREEVYKNFFKDKIIVSTTKNEEDGIKPFGYRAKMPAPLASLGINQLHKIDEYNEKRRNNAKIWEQWCKENKYKKPLIIKDSIPVYLRYPVLVEADKKKNVNWAEEKFGVEIGKWFISNIHPTNEKIQNCPSADRAVKECINFPCLFKNRKILSCKK